jgi:tetratricopeptide (TPR) repeat protein
MTELPEEIHTKIQEHSQTGDNFAEDGNFPKALEAYWNAFDLIPEPKTNWEASTWVLAAIGDANFLGNDFKAGVDNLSHAMHCPGAIGNPFIHMRLGQCQLEVGNEDRAADELTRAYALAGEEIFSNDSPKYLDFLKTKIKTEKPERKPWWKFKS